VNGSEQLSSEFQTIAPTPQRRIRQRFLDLSGKPVIQTSGGSLKKVHDQVSSMSELACGC
jgi:hypothetical protein